MKTPKKHPENAIEFVHRMGGEKGDLRPDFRAMTNFTLKSEGGFYDGDDQGATYKGITARTWVRYRNENKLPGDPDIGFEQAKRELREIYKNKSVDSQFTNIVSRVQKQYYIDDGRLNELPASTQVVVADTSYFKGLGTTYSMLARYVHNHAPDTYKDLAGVKNPLVERQKNPNATTVFDDYYLRIISPKASMIEKLREEKVITHKASLSSPFAPSDEQIVQLLQNQTNQAKSVEELKAGLNKNGIQVKDAYLQTLWAAKRVREGVNFINKNDPNASVHSQATDILNKRSEDIDQLTQGHNRKYEKGWKVRDAELKRVADEIITKSVNGDFGSDVQKLIIADRSVASTKATKTGLEARATYVQHVISSQAARDNSYNNQHTNNQRPVGNGLINEYIVQLSNGTNVVIDDDRTGLDVIWNRKPKSAHINTERTPKQNQNAATPIYENGKLVGYDIHAPGAEPAKFYFDKVKTTYYGQPKTFLNGTLDTDKSDLVVQDTPLKSTNILKDTVAKPSKDGGQRKTENHVNTEILAQSNRAQYVQDLRQDNKNDLMRYLHDEYVVELKDGRLVAIKPTAKAGEYVIDLDYSATIRGENNYKIDDVKLLKVKNTDGVYNGYELQTKNETISLKPNAWKDIRDLTKTTTPLLPLNEINRGADGRLNTKVSAHITPSGKGFTDGAVADADGNIYIPVNAAKPKIAPVVEKPDPEKQQLQAHQQFDSTAAVKDNDRVKKANDQAFTGWRYWTQDGLVDSMANHLGNAQNGDQYAAHARYVASYVEHIYLDTLKNDAKAIEDARKQELKAIKELLDAKEALKKANGPAEGANVWIDKVKPGNREERIRAAEEKVEQAEDALHGKNGAEAKLTLVIHTYDEHSSDYAKFQAAAEAFAAKASSNRLSNPVGNKNNPYDVILEGLTAMAGDDSKGKSGHEKIEKHYQKPDDLKSQTLIKVGVVVLSPSAKLDDTITQSMQDRDKEARLTPAELKLIYEGGVTQAVKGHGGGHAAPSGGAAQKGLNAQLQALGKAVQQAKQDADKNPGNADVQNALDSKIKDYWTMSAKLEKATGERSPNYMLTDRERHEDARQRLELEQQRLRAAEVSNAIQQAIAEREALDQQQIAARQTERSSDNNRTDDRRGQSSQGDDERSGHRDQSAPSPWDQATQAVGHFFKGNVSIQTDRVTLSVPHRQKAKSATFKQKGEIYYVLQDAVNPAQATHTRGGKKYDCEPVNSQTYPNVPNEAYTGPNCKDLRKR